MKYLFIGGPADGRRDEVADGQDTVRVLALNESPFSFIVEKHYLSDVEYREARDYLYHRHRSGSQEFFVYHGLTISQAVNLLIRRYPQPL